MRPRDEARPRASAAIAPRPLLAAILLAALFATGCGDGVDAAHDFDWRPAAPAPVARVEGAGAVVDGRLLVFGGLEKDRGLRALTRVDAYDPVADRWEPRADLPSPVTHVIAAVDGERVWLSGGFVGDHPGVVTDRTWVYDAAADAWSEGPPLPEPRASGGLVRVGRHLHYFGGFAHDRDTTYGDHWRLALDAAAPAWEPRAPLPEPRGHLAVATLDGRAFAVGGQFNHDHDRRDVRFVHAYDPEADAWEPRAPLPTPRSHAELSTFAHAGRLFLFGGRDSASQRGLTDEAGRRNTSVPDVDVYDPRRDRWLDGGRLPHALLAPVVAVLDGRLVLTNGSTFNSMVPRRETWIGRLPD